MGQMSDKAPRRLPILMACALTAHYPFSANKTSVRTIANGLMDARRSETTTFGGFSSIEIESAREGRPQLWRLAEVLFDVVPHLAAMSAEYYSIASADISKFSIIRYYSIFSTGKLGRRAPWKKSLKTVKKSLDS